MPPRQAWKDGHISETPAERVDRIKKNGDQGSRRAFTLEEVKRLVAAADDEWKGLILCGLYTGQRLGDIARLTWNLVDLQRQEIIFLTGKTGRQVILPLAKPLHEYFLSQSTSDDPEAPVFARAYQVVTVQNRVGSLSNRFYDLMVQAGLAPPRKHRKTKEGPRRKTAKQRPLLPLPSPHSDKPAQERRGLRGSGHGTSFGHESKAVTANYTHIAHIEDSTKREALNELPNVL